ncbi:MAG TPA: cupin domain-containing protein [Gemmatimonadales bacterium]|jgi:quercetin dioxygenase-like cupin family protein
MRSRFLTPSLAALALLVLSAAANAQAPALAWGPAPAVFPAGAKMAVLQGDPSKAEGYAVRLDMPSGYKIPPHFHPTDEHVTVISGTFLVGMGDSLDAAHTTALPAGAFITAGANLHHYAIARGRTVVQVHGIGPFALTYVHAQDQPR